MKYLAGHTTELYSSYIISKYYTTHEPYRNGASIYICTCELLEYCANQNVTTVQYGFQTHHSQKPIFAEFKKLTPSIHIFSLLSTPLIEN